MQGNSPIYSPWYIKEIRFNRKLMPNTSLGAYGPPVASQAFQTGGDFIRWKIVEGHAKKLATKNGTNLLHSECNIVYIYSFTLNKVIQCSITLKYGILKNNLFTICNICCITIPFQVFIHAEFSGHLCLKFLL